jgi:hypothetical protein
MNRRVLGWTMLLATVAHGLAGRPAAQTASSEVVRVAALVRDGGRAVPNLSGADFVVTDNEVSQRVDAVSANAIPLDVTLVMDPTSATAGVADRLAKEAQQVTQLLRREDTLRILRIDGGVQEWRPTGPLSKPEAPTQTAVVSAASLHDALVAALVRPVTPARHHLVVAFTDGLDTASVTTADRVREVASRSDAVLQVITVRPQPTYRAPGNFKRPRTVDRDVLILAEAAERTGGELRGPGLFADATLASAFKRVLEDFQHSYVLRYTPQGVEHDGWHELSVSLPKYPNATVRARQGYHGS